MKFYLALDGTKDVTQAVRCERAALIGKNCHVCVLPEGKDPDELTVEEIDQIENDARPVLTEWIDYLNHLETSSDAKREALQKFLDHVREWNKNDPGGAGDVRAEICGGLGWTEGEYSTWLGAAGDSAPISEAGYPGQPAPYPGIAKGEVRPELRNFEILSRDVTNDKGESETKKTAAVLSIDRITARLQEITGGWPLRVKSPGSRQPLLFVEQAEKEEVRWLSSSEQFAAWVHEVATPKFNPKQDKASANYVRPSDLFHSLGGSKEIREYLAVQARPHEPLITGHYYTWRPPTGYVADGRRFAGLLKFFSNTKDAASRAVLAAAFMTPAWGGPYGKRPSFCVTAADRGYGKSTIAWAIGKVWGGAISVDFSQRGEDQLVTRLLSPDALLKVCCLVDNVKGALSSAKLEALITDEWINGHALFRGDASRPNVLTWFITANGVRLSRDLAQRSFFVELDKPKYFADWEKKLSEYIGQHAGEIVADVVFILRTARASKSLGLSDRWARWCEEVLMPACTHPAIAGDVVAEVSGVIKATQTLREDCDTDLEEAEMLVQGLLQRICGVSGERWAGAGLIVPCTDGKLSQTEAEKGIEVLQAISGQWYCIKPAVESFFIRSEEMLLHWPAIFGKRLNAKQIKHIIREARESGRIVGLDEKHSKAGNGYEVSPKLLNSYVDDFKKSLRRPDAGGSVG